MSFHRRADSGSRLLNIFCMAKNHHFTGHLGVTIIKSLLLAGAGQKIFALSHGLILPYSVRKKNQMSGTVDSVYQVHFALAREKDTSGLSSDIGRSNINATSNVLTCIFKILADWHPYFHSLTG